MGLKDGGKPHYVGHRERLRQRFRDAGADAVPDYELLELILFRAAQRRDTEPLAKALLARVRHLCRSAKCPRRAVSRGARHRRGRDHRDQTRACGGHAVNAWRSAGTSGAVLLDPGARLLPSLDVASRRISSVSCSSCLLSPFGSEYYDSRPHASPCVLHDLFSERLASRSLATREVCSRLPLL